ncbi:MAG: hypothetical protein ACRC76_03215 [Proteocatella sp.]
MESLTKRLTGFGNIDPELSNQQLAKDRWLTDIIALGYNNHNIEAASLDIYELQKPLMGVLIPERLLEDYRASLFLTQNRFSEEIFAWAKYMEIRDEATYDEIVSAFKEELSDIDEGSFMIS